MPKDVALSELDAEGAQGGGLVLGLNPLGDEAAARGAAEVAHADDQGLAPQVRIDPPDEADVELHEVRSQVDDVSEVGDPRPRVVDREADVAAELPDRRAQGVVVPDVLVLGDLEDERPLRRPEDLAQAPAIRASLAT
jgi:hypothetical protein